MIDVPAPPPDATLSPTAPRFRGVLRLAGTQVPISGVRLDVLLAPAVKSDRREQPMPKEWLDVSLAQAVTDADGAFGVTLDTSVLPHWAAPLLECGDTLRLRLVLGDGKQAVTPSPLPSEWADNLVFEIPYREPARAKLDTLLKAAAAADIGTLAGLAAYARSLTASHRLDPVESAEAVVWLERTFLDPTGLLGKIAPLPQWTALQQQEGLDLYEAALGKAADRPEVAAAFGALKSKALSFGDVGQVDWPMDFKHATSGKFGDLVDKTGSYFTGPSLGGLVDIRPLQQSPYVGYRDYLVETWQKYIVIRNKNPWGSSGKATPAQALEQLNNRFKQTFTTTVTTRSPANKLVIDIVGKILTANKPPSDLGYGLGFTDLPAQGTMSDREYLDTLIAKSGVSAHEFSLRYRLDVSRLDSALSSPVEENITALLGFFRDSFQSESDPANANPNVYEAPIVQSMMLETAPFFLEYEEWLDATAPFYPENFLSLRRMLDSSQLRVSDTDLVGEPNKAWFDKTATIMDEVNKGHLAFDQGEYQIAYGHYAAAWNSAFTQMQHKLVQDYDYGAILSQRRGFKVSKKIELLKFELLTQPADINFNSDPLHFANWNKDREVMWLILFFSYGYYVWMGDTLLALGRLPEANRHYAVLSPIALGVAEFDNDSGPFDYWNDGDPDLYQAGNLPYTVMNAEREASAYTDPVRPDTTYAQSSFSIAPAVYEFRPKAIAPLLHKLERKFIALRLGDAMLTWADMLFRSNDPSGVARSRELYKAVMWLHGEDADISPHWKPQLLLPGLFFNVRRNPALASQTQRASLALYKIANGLNYYGYTDAYVPTLRYRTLKDSADRFAALAKAAQQDFISAMSGLENLTIEELKISNLVTKALKQQDISTEQIKIANIGVSLAQQQVDAVQKQIDAKYKELADKDSFGTQFTDFMGGMVKTFTGLPNGAGAAIGGAAASEAGISSAGAAGFMGIGAAATVTAGFAVFAYAGYTSMSAMVASYNGVRDQIKALETIAMPAAQMAKTVKQSELKIAQINSDIVAADILFGRNLLAYYDNKLLNADFFVAMSNVMKRAMQRYLELGAWSGWLAERALAFEQSRSINIMRLDYFPRALQGVTGADLLQLDLAELEASRIAGTRAMVPFRHTFSLMTDFPLTFGQVKLLGRGEFLTDETSLRTAYPGTFGHRIDTVSVTLSGAAATKALRGVLSNAGVSIASRDSALSPGPLVTTPTALPIGELNATTRLSDTALPSDILRPFEGSGTTSLWRLVFSDPPTMPALNGLLDVLVTIEGRALYAEAPTPPPPATGTVTDRSIMLSGRQLDAVDFAKFAAAGTDKVKVTFDLPTLLPPGDGETRKIVNMGVLFPGSIGGDVKATIQLAGAGTDIGFKTKGGYALSNGEPLRFPGSTVPDSPLNPAIGATLEQKLVLSLSKAANAGVDFTKLSDVMLLVEYSVQV